MYVIALVITSLYGLVNMSNVRTYRACFAVSLQTVCAGIAMGWISPMIPLLMSDDSPIPVDINQASWLASLLHIASACSTLFSFIIVDTLGRKVTLLITVIPSTIGWVLMLWATTITDLYASRVLFGITDGIMIVAASMYLSEISAPNIRGTMVITLPVAVFSGILLGYVIGIVNIMHVYSYVCIILVSVYLIIFTWFPETPYHLVRKKRYEECRQCLEFLRDSRDVKEEMDSIMRSVEFDTKEIKGNKNIYWPIHDLLSRPGGKKVVMMAIGLPFINNLAGTCVFLNYAQSIFASIDNFVTDSSYLSLMLGIGFFCGYILYSLLLGHVGRKALFIISSFFSMCITFTIGTYFYFQNTGYAVYDYNWVPTFCIILYVFIITIGTGNLSVVIINEIIPTYARAVCLSISQCINYTSASILVKVWLPITHGLGIYVGFWILSFLNCFNFAIAVFCIAEAKRQSLQQMQKNILCLNNM